MFFVRVFYLPPDCRALGVYGFVGGYRFGAVFRVLEILGSRDFGDGWRFRHLLLPLLHHPMRRSWWWWWWWW